MRANEMFTGMRVLELASVLAGPAVGQFFAELGAEVIKVENPHTGGDVTRSWRSPGETTDDRSAYFCSVNWGKKSIALDFRKGDDLAVVHKLAAKADIVLASFKPGDAGKNGVSYHQLKSINASIVYGQISGYGPDSDRVGYDAVIQAESGFMDLNGDPSGPPMKMPVALVDILAAHQLKEALLLALLKREKTGEGSFVEVSLIQAAVASLANQASNWLVGGKLPHRSGSLHPNIAPYGEVFATRDGMQLLLAVGSDKQFQSLCTLLEINASGIDPDFSSNENRVKNRSRLQALLADKILQWPGHALLARLHEAKIPAGAIQSVDQVFAMPEAQGILLKQDGLTGVATFIAHWHDTPNSARKACLPPPHLGEHTRDIISSL